MWENHFLKLKFDFEKKCQPDKRPLKKVAHALQPYSNFTFAREESVPFDWKKNLSWMINSAATQIKLLFPVFFLWGVVPLNKLNRRMPAPTKRKKTIFISVGMKTFWFCLWSVVRN